MSSGDISLEELLDVILNHLKTIILEGRGKRDPDCLKRNLGLLLKFFLVLFFMKQEDSHYVNTSKDLLRVGTIFVLQ